jgi:GNAT superfamily N-acetyltransferase
MLESHTPTRAIEPVFVYAGMDRIELDERCEPMDAWRHFTSMVARDQLDLAWHVRRVLLACRPPLTDRVFGALIDLYLALGSQGRGLRQAMLERAEPWLDPEDATFLRAYLDLGLRPDSSLPAALGSLLDRSVSGSAQMVARQRVEVMEASALERASSLLEHGDLDGARSLLEEALLLDPADTQIATELLLIYRHSRDDAAQAAMTAKLQASGAALPEGWTH